MLKRSGQEECTPEKVMIMSDPFTSPCPVQYDDISSPPILRRTNRSCVYDIEPDEYALFIPIPSFEGVDHPAISGGEKSAENRKRGSVLTNAPRPVDIHPSPPQKKQYETPLSQPKMRRRRLMNCENKKWPPTNLCLPSLGDDTTSNPSIFRDHGLKSASKKFILNIRRYSEKSEYLSNEEFMHIYFQPPQCTDRATNVMHRNTIGSREKELTENKGSSVSSHLPNQIPDLVQNKMTD